MIDALYIHIPYCLSKCKYCDFYSVECKKNIPDLYISALCEEIKYRLKFYNVTTLDTIYIGGGTPSLLSEKQLLDIFSSITKVAAISSETEITIEVNPDDITVDLLNFYKKTYINRISCGIQSLTNDVLINCGRRADYNTNIKAISLLNQYWNKDLSFDLICGLPKENLSSFINTIELLVSYKPAHISMYSLTIESSTPFGKMYENGELQYDFDFSDDLWLKGYELLKKSGYEQYEVSNFCLKGKASRHNLKYWNHCDYIGCGSGATGTVYNSDGSGLRWANTKKLDEYISYWNGSKIRKSPCDEEIVTVENSKFEFFMMGLRKRSGIKQSEYLNIFSEGIPEKYIEILQKWNGKGLVDIEYLHEDTIFRLNEKGLLFLNSFLEELI